MNLTESERAKYAEVWSIPDYDRFSPGERYAAMLDSIDPNEPGQHKRVLDAGCGAGKGGLALEKFGYHVNYLDIVRPEQFPEGKRFIEACLWHRWAGPEQFDWIYCCDVMEHIPTEMVGRVLYEFRSAAPRAFFAIALVPDQMVDGEQLHLTVRPFTWWRDFLTEFGEVEARDLMHTGIYMVDFGRA